MAKTFQMKPFLLKLLVDHCQLFGLTNDDPRPPQLEEGKILILAQMKVFASL